MWTEEDVGMPKPAAHDTVYGSSLHSLKTIFQRFSFNKSAHLLRYINENCIGTKKKTCIENVTHMHGTDLNRTFNKPLISTN